MDEHATRKRWVAGIVLLLLWIFVVLALWPYKGGLLSAVILFVLFNPSYRALVNRGWRPWLAAVIVLTAATLLVLIPIVLLFFYLQQQVVGALKTFDPQSVLQLAQGLPSWLSESVRNALRGVVGGAAGIVTGSLSAATNLLTALVVMYFTLFALLISQDRLKRLLFEISPFKRQNTARLIDRSREIIFSSVVTTGILAVLQGVVLGIGFLILGIDAWLLCGLLTIVVSFIPVIGSVLVWGPVAVWAYFASGVPLAIGVLVVGIIASNSDNFIRPIIQRRIGSIPTLVSLLGILIGIPIFGLLGLVLGPLILSLVLLLSRMYREEFLGSRA